MFCEGKYGIICGRKDKGKEARKNGIVDHEAELLANWESINSENGKANRQNFTYRIYELMKELSQSYNVVPVISNFNLSQLKLVSQSNPDTWFVFNIQ